MFINQLKESIQDEYKAYHHYKSMGTLTSDPLWKSFIQHIYEDEKSHYEMFQQMHYLLTGEFVPNPKKEIESFDLKDSVKKALVFKLDTIETYKLMLLRVPMQQGYGPMHIALYDEMEHAIRFSTMYHDL